MKEKELVSVIIPVYCVEEYLDRCVRSVLKQTYSNIEVILVDDGSPDSCGLICDAFAKQDNRVVVVHKENGGLSSARNAGIKVSRGKYISFVDSDDWVSPNFISKLVSIIKNSGAHLAACDFYKTSLVEEKEEDLSMEIAIHENDRFLCALTEKCYAGYAWNKLFLSQLIKEHNLLFDEKVFNGEDLPFIVEYLCYAHKVAYTKAQLYYYYVRTGSITTNVKLSQRYITILRSRERVLRVMQAADPQCVDMVVSSYLMHLIKIRFLMEPVKEGWKNEYGDIRGRIKRLRPQIFTLKGVSIVHRMKLLLMGYLPLIMGRIYRQANKV